MRRNGLTGFDDSGSPLREFRERMGLTVTELAAALGLHYSALYNAETGLQAIPRKAYPALAELGADVAELLEAQKGWEQQRAAARRQAILAKQGAA